MVGQELEVQQKKELTSQQEKTIPARFYVPPTDIFETGDALKIVMEVPGVPKDAVDVKIENEVLSVEGRIETTNYNGLDPLYTEYPIGHCQASAAREPLHYSAAPSMRIAEIIRRGEKHGNFKT